MNNYKRVPCCPDDDSYDADAEESSDLLGDIPNFKRRRREAIASAMPTGSRKSAGTAEQWELAELLEKHQAATENRLPTADGDIPLADATATTELIAGCGDQLTTGADLSDLKDPLSELDEDSEDDENTIKKYAKLILPHVGLVLLTCAYALIGATIFYSIEGPNEQRVKAGKLAQIEQSRAEFLDRMWNLSRIGASESRWKEKGARGMQDISDELFLSFEKQFLTAIEVRTNRTVEIWSFSTAIFFSVTVVTTIGYGNPVPVTLAGRLICVVYALFGIPLTLVTIADIGKFFSEHLIWLYGRYLALKHLIKMRLSHDETRKDANHVCNHCQRHSQLLEEKKIPATLVLGILLGYTALGGLLMSRLEPWNFVTSFYFSFITMTTVGFGDLMPRRDQYMYAILLYILLGLAITTMCIDLVGVQYIRKIHYLGRKMQGARDAFAIVGGKVYLVSDLYQSLRQRSRSRGGAHYADSFIIENLFLTKHLIPYIPRDIRRIRYIDQGPDSLSTSSSSVIDTRSCRYCHSRFSISAHAKA